MGKGGGERERLGERGGREKEKATERGGGVEREREGGEREKGKNRAHNK